jgi:hypothetical protein
VIFVVRLFPPAPMADDRFAQTYRTQAKNRLSGSPCPVGFEVVLRSRKCDKQYRDRGAPPITLTLPGFERAGGAFTSRIKSPLEKDIAASG